MNRLIAALGMLCLVGCGREQASKGTELVGVELDEGLGRVQSMSAAELGCQGLEAAILSPLELVDGRVVVQFNTTRAVDGEAHLAAFRLPGKPGEQTLEALVWRGYTVQDKSFTIELALFAKCGDHYQIDAGCGRTAPQGGKYLGSSDFIMSWEVGVKCAPTVRPTPVTTPVTTPVPTMTPTPGPSPTPTATPSPSPSPSPTLPPPSQCWIPSGVPLLCHAPYGSPASECSAFGLVVLGKDDNLSDPSHRASMDADMALVKDGRGPCGSGQVAYRTYKDVSRGDTLWQPLGAGDISYVTYCGCP